MLLTLFSKPVLIWKKRRERRKGRRKKDLYDWYCHRTTETKGLDNWVL